MIGKYLKKLFSNFDNMFQPVALKGKTVHIGGEKLKYKRYVKYKTILIVDDIPRYAEAALQVLKEHFSAAEVLVHIVYDYQAALTAFSEHEIKLVILDYELEDENGDGEMLMRQFCEARPELVVLANSGKKKLNEKLLELGAAAALEKDPEALRQWLQKNCDY